MRYQVEFKEDGKQAFEDFENCDSAGFAFAKCQKLHPNAQMIHCTASSGIDGFEAKMEHDYVPVQRPPEKPVRPARPPKPDEKDGVMPFYDEVKNR